MSALRGGFYEYLSYALRIVRIREWWDKLLHLTGSAFLLLLNVGSDGLGASAFVLYTIGVLSLLVGGYAINEAADFPQDEISGRQTGLIPRREHSFLVALATLALGLFFLHAATHALLPRLIAWGTLVVGVEYSLPPLRFKERGAWGVIVGAAAQRPALFLVFLAMRGVWNWLGAVLSVWLFCGGMLGILGHQIMDLRNDQAAGVRTFVTRHGQRRALFLCMLCAVAIVLTVLTPLFLVPIPDAMPIVVTMAALSSVYAAKGLKALGKIGPHKPVRPGEVTLIAKTE